MQQFHEVLAGQSTLIIFDDVWDVQQAVRFRPGDSSFRVLLVTRNERIADALRAPAVNIGGVSPDFATDFLGVHFPSDGRLLSDVAQSLHFNPLALNVASHLLDRGISPDALLDGIGLEEEALESSSSRLIASTIRRLLVLYGETLPAQEKEKTFFPMRISSANSPSTKNNSYVLATDNCQ